MSLLAGLLARPGYVEQFREQWSQLTLSFHESMVLYENIKEVDMLHHYVHFFLSVTAVRKPIGLIFVADKKKI